MWKLRCQGSIGHGGHHWCYQGDGSFTQWRNERIKDPKWKDIGMIDTPPDHESYTHPKDMCKKYYMSVWAEKEKIKRKKGK